MGACNSTKDENSREEGNGDPRKSSAVPDVKAKPNPKNNTQNQAQIQPKPNNQQNAQSSQSSSPPKSNQSQQSSQPSNQIKASTSPKNTQQEQKPQQQQGGSSGMKEDVDEDYLAFAYCLKSVLIVLLRRLCSTFGFEHNQFQKLAVMRKKPNYMDIIQSEKFVMFAQAVWEINEVPDPEVDPSDPQYKQKQFECIFEEVEDAGFRSPLLSPRSERIKQLQEACKIARSGLEEAFKFCQTQPQFTELKQHLQFFSRCLTVFDGDLVNNYQILYNNIDKICGQ